MRPFTLWILSNPVAKRVAVGLGIAVLVAAMLLVPSTAEVVQAGGSCYKANYFEEVYRDGSWHWRAVAFIKNYPIDTRVEKWRASGPRNAQFWSNSISESYGKAYIYFSWPDHVYPYRFYSPSRFSACER